jgi:predicted Rdx family selenoprotein
MTGVFAVGRTIEVVGTVGVALVPDGVAMTAPEVNTEEDLMAEGREDGEEEGTKVLDALIREMVSEYDCAHAPRSTPSGQQ